MWEDMQGGIVRRFFVPLGMFLAGIGKHSTMNVMLIYSLIRFWYYHNYIACPHYPSL